jgi:hypothetical protein
MPNSPGKEEMVAVERSLTAVPDTIFRLFKKREPLVADHDEALFSLR